MSMLIRIVFALAFLGLSSAQAADDKARIIKPRQVLTERVRLDCFYDEATDEIRCKGFCRTRDARCGGQNPMREMQIRSFSCSARASDRCQMEVVRRR
jgi:hypothetical protein